MTPLPEDSPLLISEHDRATAVRRLQEAYAGQLLPREELDERLLRVLTAGTRNELVSVLATLPAPGRKT